MAPGATEAKTANRPKEIKRSLVVRVPEPRIMLRKERVAVVMAVDVARA